MYLLRQAGNKDGILGQSVLIPQADVSKEAGRIFLKQTEELSLCSDSGKKRWQYNEKMFYNKEYLGR